MEFGDKFICKSGNIYTLGISSDKRYDFGIYDENNIEVNSLMGYYLEECLNEGKGFIIGTGMYESPGTIYDTPLRFI